MELCIRDENGLIVALLAGYSIEEIYDLLGRNPGWYRSQMEV